MQRTQAQWQAELSAYLPQTSDYVELAVFAPELDDWRDELQDAFVDPERDSIVKTHTGYTDKQPLAA